MDDLKNNSELEVVTVPKEEATFRMDEQGRWHNESGRITKPSIIRHFNKALKWDKEGFFVAQRNGSLLEKVYFPYENTALFAIDLKIKARGIILRLNTKSELPLNPRGLMVRDDNLYMTYDEVIIRFSERSLLKISKFFQEKKGETYICLDNQLHLIG
jgi:hypothetical protein